jgi:hypothetical protein
MLVKRSADECADPLFGHKVVACLPVKLGDKLAPIGWQWQLRQSSIGAAWSPARNIHENDRLVLLSERVRETGCPGDNVARRMCQRRTDDSFLQINHNQSGVLVELHDSLAITALVSWQIAPSRSSSVPTLLKENCKTDDVVLPVHFVRPTRN